METLVAAHIGRAWNAVQSPQSQAKFQERHGGYPLLQNRRMKKQRSIEQDVIEWRRYGHWSTSAKKAHFAAFVLWHGMEESRLSEMVRESAYTGGDAGLALRQAFQRESAIALEPCCEGRNRSQTRSEGCRSCNRMRSSKA